MDVYISTISVVPDVTVIRQGVLHSGRCTTPKYAEIDMHIHTHKHTNTERKSEREREREREREEKRDVKKS